MRLDIGEEPVAVKFDGFDGAILGFGSQYGSFECLVYDRQKCIEILVDRDGMDYDEALEFFEFNVVRRELFTERIYTFKTAGYSA